MANETILVVDDGPVNLKLTDLLLRKEGFKVHGTGDAEQALTILRSLHPDLMLVETQLPGINGLELARRVKADSRTRDILVVALTASAMKGDDDRAFEAGCDGYIAKPIDTVSFARQVRGYLEKRRAPPPVEAPKAEEPRGLPRAIMLTPSELESVRRRFLEEGVVRCRKLLERIDRGLDAEEAIRLTHDWAEAAQALDYPVLAILAREAEKLLLSRSPDPLQLCDALSNLMVGFVEPPEAGMGPVPHSVEAALKGKNIALVGCSPDIADLLCGALERASAKPRIFETASAPEGEAVDACALVVIHVRSETLGTRWLHPLAVARLGQPLVLIGYRNDFLDLDPMVLPRAAELLMDGWQPEEALIRLSHALQRVPVKAPAADSGNGATKPASNMPLPRGVSTESEVLVADDDLTVRMVVRGIIQGAGLKCRLAADGIEALQAVRELIPPVAILDINMPGMDGYEVLAKIRKDSLPVRVILLTARQQAADITRGFTLGADDYVVKPFNPEELLARTKRFL